MRGKGECRSKQEDRGRRVAKKGGSAPFRLIPPRPAGSFPLVRLLEAVVLLVFPAFLRFAAPELACAERAVAAVAQAHGAGRWWPCASGACPRRCGGHGSSSGIGTWDDPACRGSVRSGVTDDQRTSRDFVPQGLGDDAERSSRLPRSRKARRSGARAGGDRRLHSAGGGGTGRSSSAATSSAMRLSASLAASSPTTQRRMFIRWSATQKAAGTTWLPAVARKA